MGDVLTFGPDGPRWRPPRWLLAGGAGALIVVVVIVVVAVAVVRRDGDVRTPSPGNTTVAAPCDAAATTGALAALVIDPDRLGYGRVLERRDSTAEAGPWTVTVRRPGGTLGRNGAVVTFPVDPPAAGRRVDVNGAAGVAGDGVVVWPVGGSFARVRGDLNEAELVAVAGATTVSAGRPAVAAVTGLAVVASGPYRPPAIREMRYGSATVGEAAALGNGLTYTGVVTSSGGFEDQLFVRTGVAAGTVHCRQAVVSPVLGGSATLAWEPVAGMIALVGYSGSEPGDDAADALRRLAGRARAMSVADWQAATVDVQEQVNGLGT